MRTQDEIQARLAEIKSDDFFGFESGDLISALEYDRAREYLKEGVTAEEWDVDRTTSDDDVRKRMREYAEFAWDKCTGHRGISASRSVSHYRAWTWLIGDDEAHAFASDEGNYAPYGAPILAYLSERYGWPMPDDEETRRMVDGRACEPDCGSCLG